MADRSHPPIDPEGRRLPIKLDSTSNGEFVPVPLWPANRAANRLANLVSLCDRCHTYLERFSDDGAVTDWPTLRARHLCTLQHLDETYHLARSNVR